MLFSYRGDFAIPRHYYIVSKLGVGTSLGDLLTSPSDLKTRLKDNWARYVKDKITAGTSIVLSGELEQYVDKFDFSIISCIEPITFLEQFKKTSWYAYRFGGLQKK